MPFNPPAGLKRLSSSVMVVLQDECLTPFYQSPTLDILPFTQLILKLVVCAFEGYTRSHTCYWILVSSKYPLE